MNKFATAAKNITNMTFTENGHQAYKGSAYSKVMDFYAVAGSLRTRSDDDIKTKMSEAFAENPLLATRLLFFLSDIREGLGERHTFRVAFEWLAKNHPEVVKQNLMYVAHFNRWDSLFVLKGTNCEADMVQLIKMQLRADMSGAIAKDPISLLAKWMPSINASSKETCKLGNWFANQLKMTPRQYRQTLALLRDHLRVVEVKMSQKQWEEIDYGKVPSNAMNRYRKAFHTQDGERFRAFLGKVERGEETIKAGTLYPYDIVEKMMRGERDRVLEAQWKALPNYVDGEHNVLVMADTSGSMHGRPIATSVGLAIYFAERNHGPYKDLFLTFSAFPEFVTLQGHDLYTRIRNAQSAEWDMNTDLVAAFRKVLDVARKNNLANADLPKAIVVISDMEIDAADGRCRGDFLSDQRTLYNHYGYDLPKIVFWNVSARKDTFLADGNRPGVELASGQSASTFRNILKSVSTTPYEAMLEVLNGERYECITVPAKYHSVTPVAPVRPAVQKTVSEVRKSLEDIRANRAKTVKDLL